MAGFASEAVNASAIDAHLTKAAQFQRIAGNVNNRETAATYTRLAEEEIAAADALRGNK